MKQLLLILTFSLVTGLTAPAQSIEPIVKEAYTPFEVGEVKPDGWLHDWATTAAKGMTKTLSDFYWPFTTGWADPSMGGWWPYEQAGYYTDGLVRLGYILGDSTLIHKAEKIMQAVVARQSPDGYIHSNNPAYRKNWNTEAEDYGVFWSQAVFGRAALAYYSATGDRSVLEMLQRSFQSIPVFQRTQTQYPLSGDEMTSLRKLVNIEVMIETARYGGSRELLDRTLAICKNFESAFIDSWVNRQEFYRTAICHGVTYNEVAKQLATVYAWNGRKDYFDASANAFDFLEKNYLLPNGVNSSNEYLRGNGAFEGAETCDISDFVWSNIWLARASGRAHYGDNIERAVFNAFPGVMSPDFKLSMYETAPNRIPGLHLRYRDDGNSFKEMHWPTCCTGNLNRILPNYVINMWMHNQRQELMLLTYGPSHLLTRDGRYDLRMQTEYPFRDSIRIEVNRIPAGEKLLLRVPEWCHEAQCRVNGKLQKSAVKEGFIHIDRKWKSGDVVELIFPMKPEIRTGHERFALYKGEETYWGSGHDTAPQYVIDGFRDGAAYATVNYGALLFALPLYDKTDWGFDLNEGAWMDFNYALSPDAVKEAKVELSGLHQPFYWAKEWAPVKITLPVGKISWNPDKGDPRLPEVCPEPYARQTVTLIPYGCARYRMAVFPSRP